MFGSKDDFFFSSEEVLIKTKIDMVNHLKLHNTPSNVIEIYKDAYDYFIDNPGKFDGATILKDINTIPRLDIWAMLHDYLYIVFNVAVNWKLKYYADKLYAEEMERMGQSWEVTWVRFGLLMITHLIFTPYELIRGKRITKKQKIDFITLYETMS